MIEVPASWGEIFDKITILEIKSARMTEPAKLANVRHELALLMAKSAPVQARIVALKARLKVINEELWGIEDDIRDCERQQDFGPRFVALARSVYVTNDLRADIKREINVALSSGLMEEKSYQPYR
jgi:hypothetical protein